MSSRDHAGCWIGPRGRNSAITGLISSTGVPSIASSSATKSLRPSRRRTRQMVLPIRFGRSLPRCAKIPTAGQSGLFRGCRVPVTTLDGSTWSKRNRTSTWLFRCSRDEPVPRCCALGSTAYTARSLTLRAQREAIQALNVPQVGEHRFYDGDAPAIKGASTPRIDRFAHAFGLTQGRRLFVEEGDLTRGGALGVA